MASLQEYPVFDQLMDKTESHEVAEATTRYGLVSYDRIRAIVHAVERDVNERLRSSGQPDGFRVGENYGRGRGLVKNRLLHFSYQRPDGSSTSTTITVRRYLYGWEMDGQTWPGKFRMLDNGVQYNDLSKSEYCDAYGVLIHYVEDGGKYGEAVRGILSSYTKNRRIWRKELASLVKAVRDGKNGATENNIAKYVDTLLAKKTPASKASTSKIKSPPATDVCGDDVPKTSFDAPLTGENVLRFYNSGCSRKCLGWESSEAAYIKLKSHVVSISKSKWPNFLAIQKKNLASAKKVLLGNNLLVFVVVSEDRPQQTLYFEMRSVYEQDGIATTGNSPRDNEELTSTVFKELCSTATLQHECWEPTGSSITLLPCVTVDYPKDKLDELRDQYEIHAATVEKLFLGDKVTVYRIVHNNKVSLYYRWRNAVDSSAEYRSTHELTPATFAELQRSVRELHHLEWVKDTSVYRGLPFSEKKYSKSSWEQVLQQHQSHGACAQKLMLDKVVVVYRVVSPDGPGVLEYYRWAREEEKGKSHARAQLKANAKADAKKSEDAFRELLSSAVSDRFLGYEMTTTAYEKLPKVQGTYTNEMWKKMVNDRKDSASKARRSILGGNVIVYTVVSTAKPMWTMYYRNRQESDNMDIHEGVRGDIKALMEDDVPVLKHLGFEKIASVYNELPCVHCEYSDTSTWLRECDMAKKYGARKAILADLYEIYTHPMGTRGERLYLVYYRLVKA